MGQKMGHQEAPPTHGLYVVDGGLGKEESCLMLRHAHPGTGNPSPLNSCFLARKSREAKRGLNT